MAVLAVFFAVFAVFCGFRAAAVFASQRFSRHIFRVTLRPLAFIYINIIFIVLCFNYIYAKLKTSRSYEFLKCRVKFFIMLPKRLSQFKGTGLIFCKKNS